MFKTFKERTAQTQMVYDCLKSLVKHHQYGENDGLVSSVTFEATNPWNANILFSVCKKGDTFDKHRAYWIEVVSTNVLKVSNNSNNVAVFENSENKKLSEWYSDILNTLTYL